MNSTLKSKRNSRSKSKPNQRKHSNSPLQRLIGYTQPHRSLIWKAIACSILNKIFDLAPPVLIGMAVDVVVKQQDS
ncbi:MAG: ABC transporter ATP-binding protein, partial [Moorea sp. SIO4A3]|nr:ABC transporter ATP-binding protein [Moorena sp. SIO4A3]